MLQSFATPSSDPPGNCVPDLPPGHGETASVYRILIMHRDLDELPMLVGLLEAAGYDVHRRRIARGEPCPPADMVPDLLLVQPGIDPGPAIGIPSILMSTEAELATVADLPPRRDILVRPFRSAEVLARVAAMIERGRQPPDGYARSVLALPDRMVFEAELAWWLGGTFPVQAPRGAVLAISLDRFREVNTVFGYRAGDAALAEAVRRLQGRLTPNDLLARIGTETFALALHDIADRAEAEVRAVEMVRSLQAVRSASGEILPLNAVAGISLFPSMGGDPDNLLRRASIALQEARDAGAGRVRVFQPAGQPQQRRLRLSRDLHRALQCDEFTLHYQPQILLRTGAICGMEALLRWTHPELGDIPPVDFIPLAAEQDLLCAIGRNTLAIACRQAVAWQRAGHAPIRMAVNLSPREFYSESLVQDVAATLHATALDPHWLELEITEAMPLDDLAGAARIMRELKQVGVSLAVDDFGTGWSSLSYLRHFPLDRLKIDRSFTRDVTRAADAAAITRTVIGLSSDLDVACLAEGIEDPPQLEWLRNQGCIEGQGYLISRPLAAEAITRLLDLQAAQPPAPHGLPGTSA